MTYTTGVTMYLLSDWFWLVYAYRTVCPLLINLCYIDSFLLPLSSTRPILVLLLVSLPALTSCGITGLNQVTSLACSCGCSIVGYPALHVGSVVSSVSSRSCSNFLGYVAVRDIDRSLVILCFHFWEIVKLFYTVTAHFTFPLAVCKGCRFPTRQFHAVQL